MPMLDFYFNGWVRGVTINEALDQNGNKIDVSTMTPYELAIKLSCGELKIVELAPYLSDHITCEINTVDFTASRYRLRD